MYGDAAYRLHGDVERRTGYPAAWELVKHEVRAEAGHRCIRCGHPYRVGQDAFWSEPVPEETAVEAAALLLFEMEPTDEPRVRRERPIHWSPCDERCTHQGTIRAKTVTGQWVVYDGDAGPLPVLSAVEKQAAWRILTVHHADGNKRNLCWWNLLSLCQRCHLQVQRKVIMDRVWPHEHSDWFKPYVAGFYAQRYLGQDISKQEAIDRMGELLALERVA